MNISKKIQVESELRVNSLVVYYDLVTGSTDLKKLYINCKNKEFKNIPSRMFFSKEWINNVAKIYSNIRDTESLYKLYTDLEIVSEELKIKSELMIHNSSDFDYDRFEKIIYKISNRIFSKTFIDSNMNKYNNIDEVFNVDEELHSDFKKIITDLKSIIH
ncbi:hypothetical protein [Clostridium lacusfryxellense]|uniref:hypothetical protein n=1 Tax=Clostridium lacusfryxellense TaxID=205328 RepID=UPI001C0C3C56|nr:hypothetical protein [Clostridium lacusfryxellense]MBU3114697.1 hypothetical protein [Clostridium lacusfryxellense]